MRWSNLKCIEKKRNYIKKNVLAWLEKPTLGMVNIFTAGDKHFYRFLEKGRVYIDKI
jgi:hypothetical protein